MTDSLPPVRSRLVKAFCDVREAPPSGDDFAFLARQLVQVTLPHRDPGDVRSWKRVNGHVTLSIRPGDKGYPYGTIPRLLLFWLTREAIRKGGRRIELGDSLAEFMRSLGLNPSSGGGKRGDAARLLEQADRLFQSTISFDYAKDEVGGGRRKWLNMQIARAGESWWDAKRPEQGALWGSWVELGEDFFAALVSSPVPLDMRALQALKNSPMDLDLYAWAAWRSFVAMKSGKAQFVSWGQLAQQLGSNYSDPRDMRRAVKQALVKVRGVYPSLVCEQVDGGVNVLPSSRPAIYGG